jgi:hypothetical protein
MAENQVWIDARPDDAFSVVADAGSYAHWVVGATRSEALDTRWPEPGASFRHRQARGPLSVHDTTSVIEAQPPRRLLLEVRARPWVVAEVEMLFEPCEGGTRITMREHATGGVAGAIPGFLLDPLLKLRNAEAVRRLGAMAWSRAAVDGAGASGGR